MKWENSYDIYLRYPDHENWTFNHGISDISIVRRKTTLTISDSIQTVESEILRVGFP